MIVAVPYELEQEIIEVYCDNKKMYVPLIKKKKWYKKLFKKGK